jgi:hypothetical protein
VCLGHYFAFVHTVIETDAGPVFLASIEKWNAWISRYSMQYNCYRPHILLEYKRLTNGYFELREKEGLESSMLLDHTTLCHVSK